jgi:hypothetical protein
LAVLGCDDHLLGQAEEGSGEVTYAADYAGVQEFFVDSCDACHLDGQGTSVIDLRAEIAADVEGVAGPSGLGPFVVPGDAEASVLWLSIAQTGSANPMPLGSTTPLPTVTIAHVRDWIDAGAPL